MANQIGIISEVVARNNKISARLAPDITQAIVPEVGHPGPCQDVNRAVGSNPAIRAKTDT